MTLELPRRRFLAGAIALFAAPAIVRAASLMPVRAIDAARFYPYQAEFLEAMSRQMANALLYGEAVARFSMAEVNPPLIGPMPNPIGQPFSTLPGAVNYDAGSFRRVPIPQAFWRRIT